MVPLVKILNLGNSVELQMAIVYYTIVAVSSGIEMRHFPSMSKSSTEVNQGVS